MWCRNFPLRAFSDTRTEIISNRAYFEQIILQCDIVKQMLTIRVNLGLYIVELT